MIDMLIRLLQFFVSIGFGPIDIVLVVVCFALYGKAEALDRQLHNCLNGTDREAIDRISRMK